MVPTRVPRITPDTPAGVFHPIRRVGHGPVTAIIIAACAAILLAGAGPLWQWYRDGRRVADHSPALRRLGGRLDEPGRPGRRPPTGRSAGGDPAGAGAPVWAGEPPPPPPGGDTGAGAPGRPPTPSPPLAGESPYAPRSVPRPGVQSVQPEREDRGDLRLRRGRCLLPHPEPLPGHRPTARRPFTGRFAEDLHRRRHVRPHPLRLPLIAPARASRLHPGAGYARWEDEGGGVCLGAESIMW